MKTSLSSVSMSVRNSTVQGGEGVSRNLFHTRKS